MKINNLFTVAILVTSMTAMVNLGHADEASRLASTSAGVHGVYGRAIADVGNPDAHWGETATDAMDCSQMPCCKNMDMTGKAGADCMKMSPSACKKMLSKHHG
jgi:hypothetical protein